MPSATSPATVILNLGVPEITHHDVILAFTGRLRHWDNGLRTVIIALPKDHVVTIKFAERVLKQNTQALFDLYESADDNSQRVKVKVEESEAGVLRSVASILGAIGYIDNMFIFNQGMGYVRFLDF